MILTAGTPRFAINSFWMDLLIGKNTFLSSALSYAGLSTDFFRKIGICQAFFFRGRRPSGVQRAVLRPAFFLLF